MDLRSLEVFFVNLSPARMDWITLRVAGLCALGMKGLTDRLSEGDHFAGASGNKSVPFTANQTVPKNPHNEAPIKLA